MPPPSTPSNPPMPSTIGRYHVVRLLGSGGMATVYEARHEDLGRRVAVKVLKPHLAQEPRVRARFVREGQASSRVRHPNAVDIFDVGETENGVFLVMEYLEGETLASLIDREGPLSPQRAADLLIPVMAAVGVAHEEGIIHRDLKPSNVVLARGRHGELVPKVLDFGISKMLDTSQDTSQDSENDPQNLTGTDVILGTPYYMSPEQVEGARYVTPASDQYSLGVTLYKCATRRLPFLGGTAFATMNAIVAGRYTPVVEACPGVDPAFAAVIERAMHRSPDERYPSVWDLAAALLPFASAEVRGRWEATLGPRLQLLQSFHSDDDDSEAPTRVERALGSIPPPPSEVTPPPSLRSAEFGARVSIPSIAPQPPSPTPSLPPSEPDGGTLGGTALRNDRRSNLPPRRSRALPFALGAIAIALGLGVTWQATRAPAPVAVAPAAPPPQHRPEALAPPPPSEVPPAVAPPAPQANTANTAGAPPAQPEAPEVAAHDETRRSRRPRGERGSHASHPRRPVVQRSVTGGAIIR